MNRNTALDADENSTNALETCGNALMTGESMISAAETRIARAGTLCEETTPTFAGWRCALLCHTVAVYPGRVTAQPPRPHTVAERPEYTPLRY